MEYPPRNDEEIFNKKYVLALVILALTLALSAGLIYLLSFNEIIPVFDFNKTGAIPIFLGAEDAVSSSPINWAHAKARTMFVTVLVIAESFVVLSLRRLNKSVFLSLKEDWKWLVFVFVIFVPVLHLLLVYIKPLSVLANNLLGFRVEFVPLGILDWLILLFAITIPLASLEIYKMIIRRKKTYY